MRLYELIRRPFEHDLEKHEGEFLEEAEISQIVDERINELSNEELLQKISDSLDTLLGEPVAWMYDLAVSKTHRGYRNFVGPKLSREKPNVPEGSIRDLTPIYSLKETNNGVDT